MVSDGEIVDGQFSIDCVFWYFEDCGMSMIVCRK